MNRTVIVVTVYGTRIRVNRQTGEGLAELYDKLSPKINKIASKYFVVGKDYDDKKQELQIKLWQILRAFDRKKSCFASFYVRCLLNFVRNEIQYNNRRIPKGEVISLNVRQSDRYNYYLDKQDRGDNA